MERQGAKAPRRQGTGAEDGAAVPTGEPARELDLLASQVVDSALAVHRALGPGLTESIYEAALAIELESRGIVFSRQSEYTVTYRGIPVGQGRLDLLVERSLIVELKAVDSIAPVHRAQVVGYLRALNLQLGLLINFNVPLLRDGIHRIINRPLPRA
jgi:GxxExxY protein